MEYYIDILCTYNIIGAFFFPLLYYYFASGCTSVRIASYSVSKRAYRCYLAPAFPANSGSRDTDFKTVKAAQEALSRRSLVLPSCFSMVYI